MNAKEKLEAAITKLETLKAGAFPGPWEVLTSGIERGDHWYVISDHESILNISANDGSDEELRRPTASLIVTLHRTIDAQLAILRRALVQKQLRFGEYIFAPEALALADAILGGES